MPLLDSLQSTMHRILPEKKHGIPLQSGGIGNGHAPFEDDVRAFPLLHAAFAFFYSIISGWVCTPHRMLCCAGRQTGNGSDVRI